MELTTLKFVATVFLATAIVEAYNLREPQLQEATDVYIVVFKQEATAQEIDLHKKSVKKMGNVGPILHEYSIGNDFRGYSAPMTKFDAEKIQNHPSVKYIEKSKDMHGDGVHTDQRYYPNTQYNAPWGLVRSSTRSPSGKTNHFYIYSDIGCDSNVYVIDSGIDTSHPDFQGRAIWGFNTIDQLRTDDHGHGTHVAGTVMSRTYGVAKGATAIAVRTCYKNSQGGTTCPGAQTIGAVNWVANQHRLGSKSIINMSLGGGGFQALDDAVRAAIRLGIHVSVAAGNEWINACNVSPARVAEAVTVSAINIYNYAFYNYGSCVDISAPGVNILSILPNGTTGLMSGTSMAAPHVAGAMAVILQSERWLTPSQMSSRLNNVSTLNQILDLRPDTPNRILFIPCY